MSVSSFSFGIGLTNIPLSSFPGRRRRPWVSVVHTGCYIDRPVIIVYRCPIVRDGAGTFGLAASHGVVIAVTKSIPGNMGTREALNFTGGSFQYDQEVIADKKNKKLKKGRSILFGCMVTETC